MPTHDYIIANGTGAAVRADINLALSAIVSLNSSASEPGTMYAYQLWADTAAGLLKIRNGANSAWITLRQLDGDFSIVAVEDGLQATPSLTFTNDLNTGVFRSGADALAIVTGGQYAIACTSTQAVGIRTPNPSTTLHVAGNARVGADDVTDAHLQIGKGATGNRNSYIDIVADTTYTDYGLRIIRNNTGANATSELKHRGTGALNFTTQEAAAIEFYTTNSPRVAIDSSGRLLVGTSTALGTGQVGFLTSGANQVLTMHNSNATPFGLVVKYTTATPNGTGAQFVYLEDASALRCEIRSNGGIANYSANDANLSDRNVKKDIALAAGTWDCIKEWEIVNYRYKDQPDDAELNLGVIAQQVAESCPEVITIFQEAKDATEDKPAQEERLGVKEQQMYWMAIKALQEAMGRIETLEQRLIAAGID
jgi:hypothetical protein